MNPSSSLSLRALRAFLVQASSAVADSTGRRLGVRGSQQMLQRGREVPGRLSLKRPQRPTGSPAGTARIELSSQWWQSPHSNRTGITASVNISCIEYSLLCDRASLLPTVGLVVCLALVERAESIPEPVIGHRAYAVQHRKPVQEAHHGAVLRVAEDQFYPIFLPARAQPQPPERHAGLAHQSLHRGDLPGRVRDSRGDRTRMVVDEEAVLEEAQDRLDAEDRRRDDRRRPE